MSATVIKVGEAGQLQFRQTHNSQRGLCIVESTTIAGTRYIAGIRDVVGKFSVGDRLYFERDRQNIYDSWSIRVYGHGHVRLGYVSCDCNEFIARLIDGGKQVFGRLKGISQCDSWTRIEMGVYLDD